MTMRTLRTAVLTAALLGLGAFAPMSAGADPVEVETGTRDQCIADTTSDGDNCDVTAEVPTVVVRAADHCVGVLVETCEP